MDATATSAVAILSIFILSLLFCLSVSERHAQSWDTMKDIIKEKLIGDYKPTALSVAIFCASIVPVFLWFWHQLLRALTGNGSTADIWALAVFLVYSAISLEVNLRRVIVDDRSMSSYGPLRIYRQRLENSEITAFRQTKMRAGSTIEVLYRGRAIVFASNRRFKKRCEEALQPEIQ